MAFRRFAAPLAEDPWLVRAVGVWAVLQLAASLWDVPSGWGWEQDAIAPREVLLGLRNTFTPGEMHRYPALHFVLVALVSLPVLLWGLVTADGTGYRALEARFIEPDVMTGIAVSGKALTVALGAVALLALGRLVRRTLDDRAARWAVVLAATNLTFGYYGRTTNLDVPYLAWTALALDRLLTVVERGDRRDHVAFGLLAAASIATKDQAYAGYVLPAPLYLVVLPFLRPAWLAVDRATHFRRLAVGATAGALGLAAMNGALWNPTGFARRVAFLTGPAKEDWRVYTRTWEGVSANLRDLAAFADDFWWPWPVLAVVAAGVVVTLARADEGGVRRRAFRALPLVAALSSLAFFTLLVGRAEHRFTLPAGFWASYYGGAAVAAGLALPRARGARSAARLAAAALVLLALRGPLSLVVTQWSDGRREVEAWLAALPPGTSVETYGRILYQPRWDPSWGLDVVHVHPDKEPREQPPMRGVTRIRAPFLGVVDRRPDVVVIPHVFGSKFRERDVEPGEMVGAARGQYLEDPAVTEHFRQAVAGRLPGYRLALVGESEAPSWARALGLRTETFGGALGSTRVFVREDSGLTAQRPGR